MMFDEGKCYSPSEVFNFENSMGNSKKRKMINKRRFSDEQVKSLESIFENETKLEPKKKVQLARELGLHPRQVAIWFQNKRARYKSKLLERDYDVLRANYNALVSQFENLKKEKQSLITQLEKLKKLVGKDEEVAEIHSVNNRSTTNSNNDSSQSEIKNANNNNRSNNNNNQSEVKPTMSMEGSEYGGGGASILSSDEGSSENTNYFGAETTDMDMLAMVEPGSLTSASETWDDLHPDGLFDQTAVDSSQWWDFWS